MTTLPTSQQGVRRSTFTHLLRKPSFLIAAALLVIACAVWGVMLYHSSQPESLDQRTRDVASQLQCPICHGESVQDSPAPLASQMRGVIRQKLAAGESEQQVITYFEERYDDTILESPPQQGFTLLIWWPPVIAFIVGAYLVFSLGREWQRMQPALADAAEGSPEDDGADLSDDERRSLRALLQRELAADDGLRVSGVSYAGSEDQWDR